jgi:hypothetical protein
MRTVAFRQMFVFRLWRLYGYKRERAVMARAVVLAPIDRDFVKEVSALAKEGQKLADGYPSGNP